MPDPDASPVEQIELDFYDTEAALAAALHGRRDRRARRASAPRPRRRSPRCRASRVLDYPTTTLSAVLLNLRPAHPELRDPNVRKALLGAIDRDDDRHGGPRRPGAHARTPSIPPASWAYDASRVVTVPYDRTKAAAKLLQAAGWTQKGGAWTAPEGKAPYAIELLTVPADVNPRLAAVADVGAGRLDGARLRPSP